MPTSGSTHWGSQDRRATINSKEFAEVLRSLNNKFSGVTEMKDKELDELLVEKLARPQHKRETIAAMRAEAEAICGAARQ